MAEQELLPRIEAEIVRTLKSVNGIEEAYETESIGVLPALPYASIRWLGPTAIVDAETGGGQDVTHSWRLELTVGVAPEDEESAQKELKAIAQGVTAAFRRVPRLADLVDQVRLTLTDQADYFRRATITGAPQGPMLYGCVFRLEVDLTER